VTSTVTAQEWVLGHDLSTTSVDEETSMTSRRTMMRRRSLSLLIVLAGCGSSTASPDAEPISDGGAPTRDAGRDAPRDGGLSTLDGASEGDSASPSISGAIALTLVADEAVTDAVVSLGVPFPPGILHDPNRLQALDSAGSEVPIHTDVLAQWPLDGSVRSVLVAFRTTLDAGATETLTLRHGELRARSESALEANPDGEVAAMLAEDWYVRSAVSGVHVTREANRRFEAFDRELDDALDSMSPEYESYGVSCGTTSLHRTYYDGPHGLWQRFLRDATPARYRRARLESRDYRANELEWHDGRSLAVQTCEVDDWTPSDKLNWGVIRRMTSQGMLDDYLLTGDPAAREAVVAMGEAFVRSLPAQRGGRENSLRVTERNLAWTVMGVASYYALSPTDENRAALVSLLDEAVAWQDEGTSGAFEHDIVRPDPSECSDGPAGASPFMTALLIDALADAYMLLGDDRIPELVARTAAWLRDDAVTADGRAFRYLWGCRSDDYETSDYPDLNLLIAPVFGAAYALTGDSTWLDAGDHFADVGVEEMYVGRPKQWNQAARFFPRYLGWRASGRAP
jgi:hypothetical protein